MSLIEKAKSTLPKMNSVEDVERRHRDAEAINDLTKILRSLTPNVKKLVDQARVLESEGVAITPKFDAVKLRDDLVKIKNRFEEDPNAAVLKQKGIWGKFEERLREFQGVSSKNLVEVWRRHCQSNYFSGPEPLQRFARLSATPKNQKAKVEYESKFEELQNYLRKMPSDKLGFARLKELSDQLKKIEFDEDLSKEVQHFIAAANLGAGLDLLTPTVIEWLKENELGNHYVVVETRKIQN